MTLHMIHLQFQFKYLSIHRKIKEIVNNSFTMALLALHTQPDIGGRHVSALFKKISINSFKTE